MHLPIAIIGGGALGTFFALRLRQAGFCARLIARGARLDGLRRDGLRFSDAGGDMRVTCTVGDAPALAEGAQLVILAVKSWQVEQVVADIARHVGPAASILTLQNGVDAPAAVADRLPHNAVLAGVVHGFFDLEPDGVVRHAGVAPRLIAGVYAGGGQAAMASLGRVMDAAGIACDRVDDIRTELWRKMMIVCAVGGLGAAHDQPAGWLRTNETARDQLIALLGEVTAVARAAGAQLDDRDARATFGFVERFPAEATTSMQRDVVAGRPSELDAQNGALARWADRLGLPTPVNDWVLDRIGQRWDAWTTREGTMR